MRIGIPKEIRPGETRVALVPDAVSRLAKSGLEFVVERGAGAGAWCDDASYEKVGARLESLDSIEISARDSAGQLREFGFTATDAAGNVLHHSVKRLASPTQQLRARQVLALPPELRGTSLFITSWATDQAGHTGYSAHPGSTQPVTDPKRARRDYTTYTFGPNERNGFQVGDLAIVYAADEQHGLYRRPNNAR